jgi:hypothetical protein
MIPRGSSVLYLGRMQNCHPVLGLEVSHIPNLTNMVTSRSIIDLLVFCLEVHSQETVGLIIINFGVVWLRTARSKPETSRINEHHTSQCGGSQLRINMCSMSVTLD